MPVTAVCRRCYPLIAPTIILAAAALFVQKWPLLLTQTSHHRELQAMATILPYLPHAVFLSAALMGWCVHNAGMLLSAWFTGLFYLLIVAEPATGAASSPGLTVFLLLGLAFWSLFNRRRLSVWLRICWLTMTAALIFLMAMWLQGHEWVDKITAWGPALSKALEKAYHPIRPYVEKAMPWNLPWRVSPALAICAGAVAITVYRFLRRKDALLAGYAGILVAAWLGLHPNNTGPAQAVYFSAAGLILMVTAIWSAFTLAYHDELTGLPGRRSLNEAMASLGKTYTIAMIDVDHFKKFNDTYGHKTGDQVLKMIAAHMKRISGGAKTFRYGGEEFTALFSGKTVESARPRLEAFRAKLADSPFIVRSRARKKGSATQRSREKAKTGKAVRVTVSIGMAGPAKTAKKPAEVIKRADQALYRAKKAGRNCVMD